MTELQKCAAGTKTGHDCLDAVKTATLLTPSEETLRALGQIAFRFPYMGLNTLEAPTALFQALEQHIRANPTLGSIVLAHLIDYFATEQRSFLPEDAWNTLFFTLNLWGTAVDTVSGRSTIQRKLQHVTEYSWNPEILARAEDSLALLQESWSRRTVPTTTGQSIVQHRPIWPYFVTGLVVLSIGIMIWRDVK